MNMQTDSSLADEQISALMDGQLGESQGAGVLARLEDGAARERWQLYHLIGDVLRAPELAACGRDADFLSRLHLDRHRQDVAQHGRAGHERAMAREAANDGVFRWKMAVGVVSFAALAAIGWGTWSGSGLVPSAGGPQMAVAPPAQAVSGNTPAPLTLAGPVLRDPELDQLLEAHQQTVAPTAFGHSADFFRRAVFEGSAR